MRTEIDIPRCSIKRLMGSYAKSNVITREIKYDIEKARAVFQKMSSVFKSHSISLTTEVGVPR